MDTRTILFTALVAAAAIARAGIPGEVIAAYEGGANRWAVMSPDGSNFAYLDCGGDLTHGGSPRYFLYQMQGSNVLPRWYYNDYRLNTELVATDEDCQQTVILSNQGNMRFSLGGWSPDGRMIAVHAEEFDLSSEALLGAGIYLADVTYTAGRPTAVTNVRMAVPTANERGFAWSTDSLRIAYVDVGTNGTDLFMYDVGTGVSTNITNSPGISEDMPSYSSTDRVAYMRLSARSRAGDRYDIFSIPATGGSEVRITSKSTTGAPYNSAPSYSPDGQYISFTSGGYPLGTSSRALYRIKADGSAKAVKIAGSKDMDFGYQRWRQ